MTNMEFDALTQLISAIARVTVTLKDREYDAPYVDKKQEELAEALAKAREALVDE
jgi:hypothetical protein